MRIPLISLIAAGSVALGGCAYGGFGLGYGDPYSYGSSGYGSPYGYSGYGYSSGYGYGSGSPYYGSGYGYGYGSPYYGWNNGYYYPGTGYYVYDSYRQPHYWTDSQRSYWQSRQPRTRTATTRTVAPNWIGFERKPSAASAQQRLEQRRAQAAQRRDERLTKRTERSTARSATTEDSTDRPRRRR